MKGCFKYLFYFVVLCVVLAFIQSLLGVEPKRSTATNQTGPAASVAPTRDPNAKGVLEVFQDNYAKAKADREAQEAEEHAVWVAAVENSAQPLDFDHVARNPGPTIGSSVVLTGTVIQLAESWGKYYMRVAVDGDRDQMMMLMFDDTGSHPIEDDTVTIYAKLTGDYSYQPKLGGTITLPGADLASWTVH